MLETPASNGSHLHEVVTASAPTRVDLAGGTLDIWPLCRLIDDVQTVNLAIDLRADAAVRLRPAGFRFRAEDLDREARLDLLPGRTTATPLRLHAEVARALAAPEGLEVSTLSRVPRGSGLGGSSTLVVAALAAGDRALGRQVAPASIVARAANLEARVIGAPTGTQDYLSALDGGLGVVHFDAEGPRRTRLAIELAEVSRRLVLVHSGLPHDSALNNWAVTKGYIDGLPEVVEPLHEIAAVASELAARLTHGALDATGPLIAREWAARKRLAPGVTTDTIERYGALAIEAGAEAFKACGAGGGGAVLFWTPPERRDAVEAALRQDGAMVLDARPDPRGVVV